MLAAMTRMSGLQAASWNYETYVVMFLSALFWLMVPILFFFVNHIGNKSYIACDFELDRSVRDLFSSPKSVKLVRTIWCFVVGAYVLSNLVQSGQLVITNPEALYSLHFEFPFGLRFFARATPVAVILLYFVFFANRNKFDLVLLSVAFLVPLSRGSRIDVALSLVALCVVFSRFPVVNLSKKNIFILALVGACLIVGGVEYGNQRLNRFGLYEVTYDKVIAWRSDIVGPSMILPTVYAYFPLSFENFDQFVGQSRGSTYGLLSFDWFFTGFVKANWLPGYSQLLADASFVPISSGANVPTALMPFFSDFGAVGSFFPMFLCMGFWLYSYEKGKKSVSWFAIFALYSAAFSLSSFQGLIVSPFVAQQIVELAVIIYLCKRYLCHRMVKSFGV